PDAGGPDAGARPHPLHQRVTHAQVCGELTSAPVGRTISVLLPCRRKNARLRPGSQNLSDPSRMPRMETRETIFQKALLPASNVGGTAHQRLSDSVEGLTVCKHQQHPSTSSVSGTGSPRPHPPLEFLALR